MQETQAGLDKKHLESFRWRLIGTEMQASQKGRLSRWEVGIAYDQEVLPMFPPDHKLARFYLEEVNKWDHASNVMILKRKSHIWIIRVHHEVRAVKRDCFTCRRQAREQGCQ